MATAPVINHTDGLSVEIAEWRFNVRSSNTEPLLRLNLETRSDLVLTREKREELRRLVQA